MQVLPGSNWICDVTPAAMGVVRRLGEETTGAPFNVAVKLLMGAADLLISRSLRLAASLVCVSTTIEIVAHNILNISLPSL